MGCHCPLHVCKVSFSSHPVLAPVQLGCRTRAWRVLDLATTAHGVSGQMRGLPVSEALRGALHPYRTPT
eukprot:6480035-Amphidinium_carterae.1